MFRTAAEGVAEPEEGEQKAPTVSVNKPILQPGTYKGYTAYRDGNFVGILGPDGTASCEAQFVQILKLTEQGFYARKQGVSSRVSPCALKKKVRHA